MSYTTLNAQLQTLGLTGSAALTWCLAEAYSSVHTFITYDTIFNLAEQITSGSGTATMQATEAFILALPATSSTLPSPGPLYDSFLKTTGVDASLPETVALINGAVANNVFSSTIGNELINMGRSPLGQNFAVYGISQAPNLTVINNISQLVIYEANNILYQQLASYINSCINCAIALNSNITAATPNQIISASQTFLNTALGGGSLSTMPTTMQNILTSVGI